ncbi:hypothetical protein C2E23DRAFT_174014 [Lenzites betulinus]|nr:hypothetical protein C2E23DRAFT_174014 [Lenzites betulinus]
MSGTGTGECEVGGVPSAPADTTHHHPPSQESPIVALNNYLQKKGKAAALHWHSRRTGKHHAPAWTSQCKVDNVVLASGTGANKTLSKEAAAAKALIILDKRDKEEDEAAAKALAIVDERVEEAEGNTDAAATGSEPATV